MPHLRSVGDYRKLEVYLEARALSRDIFFRATKPLPFYLRWRLGAQLDDAADSIGSNLAEGHGRKNPDHGNAELVRYGYLAHGSACEVEHRLGGLRDRELIEDAVYTDLSGRVGRIRGQLLSLITCWRREDRGRKG
jgi:four helix bundle protein